MLRRSVRRLLQALLAGGLGGNVQFGPSVSVTTGNPALAALSQLSGLGGLLGGGLPGGLSGVSVGDDTPRQIGASARLVCERRGRARV